jgi:hypothetical protein
MKKIILVIGLLLLVSSPAYGCIGARAAGMGYANVAAVNDATAAYWNPSSMAANSIEFGTVIIGNQTEYFVSFTDNHWSFYKFDYYNQGNFWGINHSFRLTRSITASIGVFYDADDGLLPSFSATYQAKNLRYAILANGGNVRPSVSFQNEWFTACYESYDVFRQSNDQEQRFGIEIKYKEIAFRKGYKYVDTPMETFSVNTYGLGFTFKNISLDYAFADRHFLSVNIAF